MLALGEHKSEWLRSDWVFTPLLALALVASLASCSKRQNEVAGSSNAAQKTFASPAAAGAALFEAAKAGDQDALLLFSVPRARTSYSPATQ
jgi:hypothetical protein